MADTVCTCEDFSHSQFGAVVDDELLLRVIISPHQVDDLTGLPKPAAFSSDDLMLRGLSLLRLGHMDLEELEKQAASLTKGIPGRTVAGVLTAEAAAIRAIRDDLDRQLFCVLDDAQTGQPMHASVRTSAGQHAVLIKRIRKHLMDLFGPLKSASEATTHS